MSNVTLWKAYNAKGGIPEFHIVKPDTSDDEVKLANAAADKVIGVTGRGSVKDGERVEVAFNGIADVMYGGAVALGDSLRAAAAAGKHGRAIATTTAGDRVVGIALVAGADGDIGKVLLKQGAY